MSNFDRLAHKPQIEQTNSLAVISMVIGILGILLFVPSICIPCFSPISFLLGTAAAILGYMGRTQIDQSHGAEVGRQMAVAGLIMGLVVVVVFLLLFIIIMVLGLGFDALMGLPVSDLEELLNKGLQLIE